MCIFLESPNFKRKFRSSYKWRSLCGFRLFKIFKQSYQNPKTFFLYFSLIYKISYFLNFRRQIIKYILDDLVAFFARNNTVLHFESWGTKYVRNEIQKIDNQMNAAGGSVQTEEQIKLRNLLQSVVIAKDSDFECGVCHQFLLGSQPIICYCSNSLRIVHCLNKVSIRCVGNFNFMHWGIYPHLRPTIREFYPWISSPPYLRSKYLFSLKIQSTN